jgi:hypothetical protein
VLQRERGREINGQCGQTPRPFSLKQVRTRGPLPPSVLRFRLSVAAEALVQKHHREQLLPHLACVALPPDALTPSAHKRVRGETLAGSRGGAAKSRTRQTTSGRQRGKIEKGGGGVTASSPGSCTLACGQIEGGGHPMARPRGKLKKEVAAWAAARLVSTMLMHVRGPWGRRGAQPLLLSATAASGHTTNLGTPVACTVLQ